ncbi:MAG: hypothetical protein IJB21_05885 [Bacilli bacterium]|nr:hypothetical protein [Bacilli bacterium]
MKCFIHLNNDSSSYCSVCKRPICKKCESVENGICPRCSNFTHKTIFNYNKKIILFLLVVFFVRITAYYDVVVLTIYNKGLLSYSSTSVILLIGLFIPFCINIIRYGFKNAIKYQAFGKTSAIEIADNKKWKSVVTYMIGILSFIILCILYIVFTPLFIVTDLIHLIKSVKDFFYHKKRILTETQINKLG